MIRAAHFRVLAHPALARVSTGRLQLLRRARLPI